MVFLWKNGTEINGKTSRKCRFLKQLYTTRDGWILLSDGCPSLSLNSCCILPATLVAVIHNSGRAACTLAIFAVSDNCNSLSRCSWYNLSKKPIYLVLTNSQILPVSIRVIRKLQYFVGPFFTHCRYLFKIAVLFLIYTCCKYLGTYIQ